MKLKESDMQLIDSDNKINIKDLLNLENDLELKLPTEYKEFLLKNNGGYVSEFLCTPNFIEVDPLTQSKYLQSTNVDKFYSLAEIEEEIFDNKEDPVFPLDYIPIAYDSCGNIILLNAKKVRRMEISFLLTMNYMMKMDFML